MEKNIPVYYEGKLSYHIDIQTDFSMLLKRIIELGYGTSQKLCIVTDSNVEKFYGNEIQELLSGYFSFCGIYVFPAGEASKHTGTVGAVYEYLIQNEFDRNDLLLALGGGVVGDLTGFTAATYLRGIDFIQVPTTLLAQVDSSIGGKTGVDFMQYKNMVGAFYMPKLVYMNLSALHTLSDEQFLSGMGEIIKHGLIKEESYYEFLRDNHIKIRTRELDTKDMYIFEKMVHTSCMIKREVVQNDPKEKGDRALLNFGHTIGHAIEKLSDFQLTHGECVALGMVSAGYISKRQGNISAEQLQKLEQTIKWFHLPTRLTSFPHTPEEILKVTKLDKKMESGKIKFVLLRRPGEAYITKELKDKQLIDGITYLFTSGESKAD